jgi:hypothetical protein
MVAWHLDRNVRNIDTYMANAVKRESIKRSISPQPSLQSVAFGHTTATPVPVSLV